MRRELAVAGAADPVATWTRYARVKKWPSWAPFITSVDASGEVLEPGLTGVVGGPLGLRVSFVVTAVDITTRSWAWSVRSGPIAAELEHEVLARPTGGSVATLVLIGPAPVVLAYAPAAFWALRRLTTP